MSVVELTREIECKASAMGARQRMPIAHEILNEVNREAVMKVNSVLQSSPYRPIRRVVCQMRDHILTLTGTVPSYHMKQVAQTLAKEVVANSLELDNQVTVDSLHGAQLTRRPNLSSQ